MNKQDFINSVTSGPLSPERRQKILDILNNNELTFDVREQIKDIIQEEIEVDNNFLTDEDKKEIEANTAKMEAELNAVEQELNKDMQFVENELKELEAMVKDVDGLVNEANIDSIKSQIDSKI